MNTNDKKSPMRVINLVLAILFLVAYVTLVVVRICTPGSAFATEFFDQYIRIVRKTAADGSEVDPTFLQTALNSLINIGLILSVAKVLRSLFRVRFRKSDRAKTVVSLLDGFVKYGAAIAVIIYLLKACGVNAMLIDVSVLMAAMPAGSTTAMLAASYDGDAPFASGMIFMSTLLSMVTLPLIGLLFGG